MNNFEPNSPSLGIAPEVKPVEPDLKDVLRENLSKLPTPVRELVEKRSRHLLLNLNVKQDA